jgi:hypothetical protein
MRGTRASGEECVFKKSSFSEVKDPMTCVEVGHAADRVFVRHSVHRDHVLEFNRAEWNAFIQGVKSGEFEFD